MTRYKESLAMCANIEIKNFSKYLQERYWKLFDLPGKRNFFCYQFENENFFEQIDIPKNKELFDFNKAMLNGCEILSNFEKRDLSEVILDVLNPMADILKFRIVDDDIVNGTMKVENAINVFERAKNLLISAATDLESQNSYKSSKYSSNLKDFIDNCRFGQTEIGS